MSDLAEFLLARIAEDGLEALQIVRGARKYGKTHARRRLVDCEAKRRIVGLWAEEWPEWHGPGSGLARTRMTADQYLRVLDAERVLGLLALPYADHPSFKEEWAP